MIKNFVGEHFIKCSHFLFIERCNDDPSCRYCDRATKCHASLNPPAGCTAYQCPTQCSVFTSCESCSSQSACQWCPLTSQCNLADHISSICRSPSVYWGGVTQPISKPTDCSSKDTPPGVTEMIYFKPENSMYPDQVRIRSNLVIESEDIGSRNRVKLACRVFPFLDSDVGAKTLMQIIHSSLKVNFIMSYSERSYAKVGRKLL